MIKTRIHSLLSLLLLLTFVIFGLVSCSENDDTVEEFPDWANVNDIYFNRLSDSVANIIAQNPSQAEWKRIKCWSKSDTVVGKNTDYIVVKVIESAPSTETASPLYTDTVSIHYAGKYLPSTSYPTGYVFDRTFSEPFDADISVPYKSSPVSAYTDGFATALQYMRRGDHWLVYIPYQLGYGNPSSRSSIEDGSTLIFDLRLVDFWSPE